jgi:ketose-bisphosphate aldolase
MLVNSKKMLETANRSNYAIPSPDFCNLNMLRSYIEVAEKMNQPIIVAYSESMTSLLSLEDAYKIGQYYAKKASVPVALHIDHGKTFDFIKKAIDLGFTSVMIDASTDSFDDNVRKTKAVVEYAHPKNVTVEAEIGHVGSGLNYEGELGGDSIYTEVDDLINFVEQTGIDSVAVSVGTAHGIYKGTPKINFERLIELKNAVDIPLVLHGGSSSGDDNLRRCAEIGISKVNIYTDLIVAAANAIKTIDAKDYNVYMKAADEAFKKILEHYYRVLNCY